jgi:hypothetical protein
MTNPKQPTRGDGRRVKMEEVVLGGGADRVGAGRGCSGSRTTWLLGEEGHMKGGGLEETRYPVDSGRVHTDCVG